MKKTILVLETHSFVDVITNSSSELFVCDTNKSVQMVNEFIENEIKKYKDEDGYWDYELTSPSGDGGEYTVETLDDYISLNNILNLNENKNIPIDKLRKEALKNYFNLNNEFDDSLLANGNLILINIDHGLEGIIYSLKETFNVKEFYSYFEDENSN